MPEHCANITNCKWTYCADNNTCLLYVLSQRKKYDPNLKAFTHFTPNKIRIRHHWYCEKENITTENIPCFGCDKKCEHVIKVSANRGISRALRRQVYERDGKKCIACGSMNQINIDHLNPVSNGGCNEIWNLATMCYKCNSNKGSRIIPEYIELAERQKQECENKNAE